MKKITIVLTLVFAFALSMSVAFAGRDGSCCEDRRQRDCCPKVEVENNSEANIENNIISASNTGMNNTNGRVCSRSQNGCEGDRCSRGGARIVTGNADSLAQVKTTVNDTYIEVTAPQRGEVDVENENGANIRNRVASLANSGANNSSRGRIQTGNAISTADVMTMANTTTVVVK